MRRMSLDADLLLDRRRLKRRLSLWRALAVLAGAGLILAAVGFREEGQAMLAGGPHVARLKVDGFIGDDRRSPPRSSACGATPRCAR